MAIDKELLDHLFADYNYQKPEDLTGENGLLKQLTKRLVERALQAELSHHLETEAHTPLPEETSASKRRNSRNGYSSKTVKADCG